MSKKSKNQKKQTRVQEKVVSRSVVRALRDRAKYLGIQNNEIAEIIGCHPTTLGGWFIWCLDEHSSRPAPSKTSKVSIDETLELISHPALYEAIKNADDDTPAIDTILSLDINEPKKKAKAEVKWTPDYAGNANYPSNMDFSHPDSEVTKVKAEPAEPRKKVEVAPTRNYYEELESARTALEIATQCECLPSGAQRLCVNTLELLAAVNG